MSETLAPIVELSEEEAHICFAWACLRELGMDAEEFVRKYEAGELPSEDEEPRVVRVVMLLPFFSPEEAKRRNCRRAI